MQLRTLALPLAFAGAAGLTFGTLNFMGANQGATKPAQPELVALTDALNEAGVGTKVEPTAVLPAEATPQGETTSEPAAHETPPQETAPQESETTASTENATQAADPITTEPEQEAVALSQTAVPEGAEVESQTEAPVETAQDAAAAIAPEQESPAATPETTDSQVTVLMPESTTPEFTDAPAAAGAPEELPTAVSAEPETTGLESTVSTPEPVAPTPETDTPTELVENLAETDTGDSSIVDATPEVVNEPLDPALPEGEPLGLIVELTDLPAEEQPRFGRTKLENNGTIYVIQGKGVPGTPLELLANDRVIAKTNVDPGGAWSLYETAALPAGLHILTLRTSLSDGRIGLSDDLVVVYVDPQSDNLEAELAVMQGEGGRLTMLSGPRFVTDLIPQAVAYGDTGLRLTGKAPAGSEVVFVLPGQSLSEAPSTLIGADGVWDLALSGGAGQTGALIQRNPVSGKEVTRQDLTLPTKPDLLERSVEEAGKGRALKIKGTTYYFF